MDIRQLKTFIAIAEHGTFAKAADAVGLTPSAVSQQIQALELEVRAELFDRSTRPITLNSQGLQMLEAAQGLVRSADDIVDAISGKSVGGTFTIGSVRSSALSLLPKAIIALKNDFPGLKIKLHVANTDELLNDVVTGRLDSAMVAEYSSVPSTLRWSPFIQEPLFVIAPKGTRIRPAAEMLTELPYVKFISRFRLANIIETEVARSGIVTNVIAEIDTITAVVACVVNGLGVSIAPWSALKEAGGEVVAVPFGEPPIYRQIGLIERRASPRAAVIDRLHQHLVSFSGEFGLTR
ncbi:LysR substrate-binding domain-containing protein (plasmid) [Ensifer adhaerens]|uniref:LysR substrate-binding domain-containing protein n=1 Tax=Ensifer adhaerens TaxID=106592 RepID=A0A9Q8YGR5_ENSAD|nr:LysR substrate-binding domain-containing protein [Ensifer adhaerens]KQX52353.1 LysR family transcriptional regulator [Ensifer sp. Root1298]KQX85555.1 LysR family transcriptional regulator [Ensifer sp. Root1312]KRC24547.1 LysR family transcriptional regulator [Ensifer sp. Root74]KRD76215.1 LysR family transcriptional regulator [Ensifer sp. Root954]MBD9498677.1 LysR family transcriptional regulator [Ensifer sp. ENS01]MBD9573306.1 LysR family transcriptional regulator [Ensifer sp. ENS08]